MTLFFQLLISGIMIGGVYGLVALGFVLIYKSSRVFNLAQGEILMLFAYVMYALVVQVGFSLTVSILIILVCCIIFGVAIERFPLRPMTGQPIFAIIVVTIGISLIIKGVVSLSWGYGGVVSYPIGIIPRSPISFWGITISQVHLWSFLCCMILLLVFTLFFRFTKMGLRMRATAESHWLAQGMGINVDTVISLTWVIAAIVCACGGFLLGNMQGITTNLSYIGLIALPAALLGGFDSIPGAIVGGILIGIAESLTGGYITGVAIRSVVPYLVVVLVLLIRPYGLFGQEEIERV